MSSQAPTAPGLIEQRGPRPSRGACRAGTPSVPAVSGSGCGSVRAGVTETGVRQGVCPAGGSRPRNKPEVSGSLGMLVHADSWVLPPTPHGSVGGTLINPSRDFRHSKAESLDFRVRLMGSPWRQTLSVRGGVRGGRWAARQGLKKEEGEERAGGGAGRGGGAAASG